MPGLRVNKKNHFILPLIVYSC